MPCVPLDQPLPHTVVIPSDLRAARDVEESILQQVEAMGYPRECTFAIRLALEEALVNAHRHGNCCDCNRHITISYDIDPRRAVVRIADEGRGFDPGAVPDPTSPERLSLPNGRGLMLMRSYLDELLYNDRGNVVQLVKERC